MSEGKPDYGIGYGKPPPGRPFQKGHSGNPRGPRRKDLSALLVAALNEPVYVTIDGKRRKITKREAIVTQMVNKSAEADLRATKMLFDMMQDAVRYDEGGRAEGGGCRSAAGAGEIDGPGPGGCRIVRRALAPPDRGRGRQSCGRRRRRSVRLTRPAGIRADGCPNVAPGPLHNGAPVWYRMIVSPDAPMSRRSRPADGGSSNGRTADSDSASLGSNPSPPASLFSNLGRIRSRSNLLGSNAGLTVEDLGVLGFPSVRGRGYPLDQPPSTGVTAPVT